MKVQIQRVSRDWPGKPGPRWVDQTSIADSDPPGAWWGGGPPALVAIRAAEACPVSSLYAIGPDGIVRPTPDRAIAWRRDRVLSAWHRQRQSQKRMGPARPAQ
jgi:hypothetical protein